MEHNFSTLVNLLWERCIWNLNSILTDEEANKFSNNDYYYLLTIFSLNKPNLSQIAEKLSLTKPAVSVIIKKLTHMKLVEKIQSQDDKRIYYVELTEKGRSILDGDTEVYRWITDMIKNIVNNDSELEVIERILSKLVERLREKNI